MSSIIDNYPTFGVPREGSLHLRSYESGQEASRIADLAALAEAAHGEGRHVLVICAEVAPHKVVFHTRNGWRDPRLMVATASDLVGATARIYALWAEHPDADLTVIIDDLQALATSHGGGHADPVMVAWLQAVLNGHLDALFDLVGLDYARYTQGAARPSASAPIIYAGTRLRRSAVADVSNLMGGCGLIADSDSVTHLSSCDIAPSGGAVTGVVTGVVTVWKHRSVRAGRTVKVTRDDDNRCWTVSRRR